MRFIRLWSVQTARFFSDRSSEIDPLRLDALFDGSFKQRSRADSAAEGDAQVWSSFFKHPQVPFIEGLSHKKNLTDPEDSHRYSSHLGPLMAQPLCSLRRSADDVAEADFAIQFIELIEDETAFSGSPLNIV